MEHLNDRDLRLFDCRFSLFNSKMGRSSYLEEHIPGASYVDLEEDLSGLVTLQTGRHPLPQTSQFVVRMGNLGVGRDTLVIAYDDGTGAQAVRLWWLMRWLGHQNVVVLDGGLKIWKEHGGELCSGKEFYAQAGSMPIDSGFRWVNAEEVTDVIAAGSGLVVDAREKERFLGYKGPLDRIAGHIPGSLNRPFLENLDGAIFKSPELLRSEFETLLAGYRAADVIHSCGSGVTACHNLLAMEYCGLSGSRLYAGSWSDWITVPTRPIVGESGRPSSVEEGEGFECG